MIEDIQTVVKCTSCDRFFGYAESNKKCPFCFAEYSEVLEEHKETKEPKMKKLSVKTHDDSFKI